MTEPKQAQLKASSQGVRQFKQTLLGVSVHWGVYALIGHGEWVMHGEKIPIPEYEKLLPRFNPAQFDAEAWIKLVKDCGAEMFIITSKHHDGFCMYDTALTDYKITQTPFQRDPLAELAEACHRHNIALHFYYSVLDWHHPDYRNNWPGYVEYYQGQVRELCTRFGQLGGILFDGHWPRNDLAGDMAYFRPGGDWDLAGTYDLIHSLQPQAMVTNNHHVLPLPGEDYQVWELDLPGANTTGFNTTEIGVLPRVAWFNLNTGWSYAPDNSEVKTVDQLSKYVTDSNKHQSVCWLNVAPTPTGEIIPEETQALHKLGEWTRQNEKELKK